MIVGFVKPIILKKIKDIMELIEDIDKIEKPFDKAVVTIGNFDGVHKGHQALFRKVKEEALAVSGTSVAITFEPHPLRALGKNGLAKSGFLKNDLSKSDFLKNGFPKNALLKNGPPLITRKDQKIELITASGVDKLICISFTKSFAAMTASTFISDLLIARIGMETIIVGQDYSFGRNREGNIDFLIRFGEKRGFRVIVPDWVGTSDAPDSSGEDRISSTMIRNLVMEGRVDETPRYLGRYYQIRGKVVKGRERGGSKLGFPTANIKLHDELCPKMGVYAVTVETVKGNFNGVANIGYSPTFDDHIFTIEAHILDFSDDLYGTRIRINMIKRLRDEKKFSGMDELSAQIHSDIETARVLLQKT